MKQKPYSLLSLMSFALTNGINVEKDKKNYTCWRKDDHSVMCESHTLEDLYEDILELRSHKPIRH
jgi:hypothetical protein